MYPPLLLSSKGECTPARRDLSREGGRRNGRATRRHRATRRMKGSEVGASTVIVTVACHPMVERPSAPARCRTRWQRCGKFHQPGSAHAEHRHSDADMASSDRAECEVGRVEADSSLPRQPFGEGPHLVRRLHLLLTEVSVSVKCSRFRPVTPSPSSMALADTGVAEPDGVVRLFSPEDLVLPVGASGTGAALVGGRLVTIYHQEGWSSSRPYPPPPGVITISSSRASA